MYVGFETVYVGFETVCPEKARQMAFYSPLLERMQQIVQMIMQCSHIFRRANYNARLR